MIEIKGKDIVVDGKVLQMKGYNLGNWLILERYMFGFPGTDQIFRRYFRYFAGDEKYYIQSAFMIPDKSRMDQETNSLRRIRDSFRKIVVVRDHIIPWHDESGILFIGLRQHPLG